MKIVTLQKLEEDFDSILDDVVENKTVYKIQTASQDVMLFSYDCYEVMADIYKEWVEEPKTSFEEDFDPYPLPVVYVDDAEPKPL